MFKRNSSEWHTGFPRLAGIEAAVILLIIAILVTLFFMGKEEVQAEASENY